jgi:hypothetical protein
MIHVAKSFQASVRIHLPQGGASAAQFLHRSETVTIEEMFPFLDQSANVGVPTDSAIFVVPRAALLHESKLHLLSSLHYGSR